MKVIVTGGAGFIGSALTRLIIGETDHQVLVLDKLTYAGNLESLSEVASDPRFQFAQIDICDAQSVRNAFDHFQPDAIIHLAAESHVDRSIEGPQTFIQTNIVGTYQLLEAARNYLKQYAKPNAFRFHHVSTDEVYGSLERPGLFSETNSYQPNSPYSASKASSDHLVHAWHHTYGLPTVLTNCSNNYGPHQFPEKLIPLMILNALEGKPLPIYGSGNQIRDWLFVNDHAEALLRVLEQGPPGSTYNIGGHNEKTNLEVVRAICVLLDELIPHRPAGINGYAELITHVADRPGHDQRYAIDASKIHRELGWVPRETFASGLRKTVQWYLDNTSWCKHIQEGSYQRQRLGLTDRAQP